MTQGQQAGIPVSIQDLMARIGTLVVERDYWQEQARVAVVEVGKLKVKDEGEMRRLRGEAPVSTLNGDEAEPPTEAPAE